MNGIYIADIGADVAALTPAEALAKARRTVRVLLHSLFPSAELLHDEKGAPYLSEGACRVSISHSGSLVAVALHEGTAVGVDVERIDQNEARAARMEKRFLNCVPAEPREKISHFPVYICTEAAENENNCFHFKKINIETCEKTEKDAWIVRWTQLEAVLKMSGDGFASYARLGELWERSAITTFSLSDHTGERYAISVALPRNSRPGRT